MHNLSIYYQVTIVAGNKQNERFWFDIFNNSRFDSNFDMYFLFVIKVYVAIAEDKFHAAINRIWKHFGEIWNVIFASLKISL